MICPCVGVECKSCVDSRGLCAHNDKTYWVRGFHKCPWTKDVKKLKEAGGKRNG
jgi:hypothetical protein